MPPSPTLVGSSALPTIRDDISRYKFSLLKGHAGDLSGKGVLSGTTFVRDEQPYPDLGLQPGVGHGAPSKQPPKDRLPHPAFHQPYPILPASVLQPSQPLSFVHQQNPDPLVAAGLYLPGPAVVPNAFPDPQFSLRFFLPLFLQQYLIEKQQDSQPYHPFLTCGLISAYVLSRAQPLVVISLLHHDRVTSLTTSV